MRNTSYESASGTKNATASILKQNPNTWKVKKNTYLSHNMQTLRVSPFVKGQNAA